MAEQVEYIKNFMLEGTYKYELNTRNTGNLATYIVQHCV